MRSQFDDACSSFARRVVCESAADAETQFENGSEIGYGRFSAWATQGNFIDAELHEELIWMEAALVCDGCAEETTCKSKANSSPPSSKLDNDTRSGINAASSVIPVCSPQTEPVCKDIDEWYSVDIESEIFKLEQQQRSLCEAQLAFETALLQWRPASENV